MIRFLARTVWWLAIAPLALALAVLAAANRGAVLVDLWPFPFAINLPLFGIMVVSVVIGFVWGGVVGWLARGRGRKRGTSSPCL